ncbi:hypothetical protein UlMin_034890 [Ulmus minor]
MAASSVRVVDAQMTSINDLASNFATCSCLAKFVEIFLNFWQFGFVTCEGNNSSGAKLICFPENFAFVGAKDGDSLSVAKPLDGPIMQQYCSLASIWLSLGGFQEKRLDDKHLCNTHVVIDDAGKIKSTYKKIHFYLETNFFSDLTKFHTLTKLDYLISLSVEQLLKLGLIWSRISLNVML